MQDLILRISKALVDHPDQVSVKSIDGDNTCVLELKVAKVDIGKVIGKQGRTAHSIRTILNAAAAKKKKRVVLEIVE
ncbi:MAG: KH domain-containing protein [Desulfobacterales bacterium]